MHAVCSNSLDQRTQLGVQVHTRPVLIRNVSAVTPSDEQEPTRLVRMPPWKIKRFALFRLGSKLQKLDNIGCDLRRCNFSTLFNPSSLVWIYLVASHSPITSSFIHKISNAMVCVNGKNSTTENCLCKTSTITANVHSVP